MDFDSSVRVEIIDLLTIFFNCSTVQKHYFLTFRNKNCKSLQSSYFKGSS